MRPAESLSPGEYAKVYPLLDPAAKTLSIRPAAPEVGLAPQPPVDRAKPNPRYTPH